MLVIMNTLVRKYLCVYCVRAKPNLKMSNQIKNDMAFDFAQQICK